MSTSTLEKHSKALDAADDGASHTITITLRIRRFNPEVSEDAT
ncbi:succinate dehydrogenase iron-sulfur subunit, partial [Winogradskyella sp. ZXX205]|nr:succinate dehydrogenase iron-sulfur subunit [Winogradskyella ouciana]